MIFDITLKNKLDNEEIDLYFECDCKEDVIFLWKRGTYTCDCNRLILWHGYNSSYNCNTCENDRIITAKISYNGEVIYNDNI